MTTRANQRPATPPPSHPAPRAGHGRRTFLTRLGATAAAASVFTPFPAIAGGPGPSKPPHPAPHGPSARRRAQAFAVRMQAAQQQKAAPLPVHALNGDEHLPGRIGSYSKGLPHDALGVVAPGAYAALVRAIRSGETADFAAIPLGGTVKLANPEAAHAYSLEGGDSHSFALRAAPAFASAETAGEMVECYWHALVRDIPFSEYATHPLILDACADLGALSDFRGPKVLGEVLPETLFRGNTPGDLAGPYLSQFLWKDIPYGAMTIPQRYRTGAPGVDYMTTPAAWLAVQNGTPAGAMAMDPTPRFLRNARDLGEYVHRDFTYQAFLNAALILLGWGGTMTDPNNPYLPRTVEGGFISFGGPHILDQVTRVAIEALKAAWCQKWQFHRRLRPEVYAGRVHFHRTGAASYPLHADVLASPVLDEVFARTGSYLLPMAYPEGSPTHPAYPAGHATIAGACATILKAFFREEAPVPAPVEAAADGLSLLPHAGPALTVGGELNKLASNIAIGRDLAGVHWRSDGIEGLVLGEQVALAYLRDFRLCVHEDFAGFQLTRFDGTSVTV